MALSVRNQRKVAFSTSRPKRAVAVRAVSEEKEKASFAPAMLAALVLATSGMNMTAPMVAYAEEEAPEKAMSALERRRELLRQAREKAMSQASPVSVTEDDGAAKRAEEEKRKEEQRKEEEDKRKAEEAAAAARKAEQEKSRAELKRLSQSYESQAAKSIKAPKEEPEKEEPAFSWGSLTAPQAKEEPKEEPKPAPTPAPAPKPAFSFSAPASAPAPSISAPAPVPKVEVKKEAPKKEEKKAEPKKESPKKGGKRRGPLPAFLSEFLVLGAFAGVGLAATKYSKESEEVGKAIVGTAASVYKQIEAALNKK